jgi:peptidoglycan/xylan/chitin deacetylase (PgdA/CDA1 family)
LSFRRIFTVFVTIAVLASLAVACVGGPATARPGEHRSVVDPIDPEPTATPVPPTPTPLPPTPTPLPSPTPIPLPRITRAAGEIDLGNTSRAEMALTFDCGASGVQTPAIIQALHDAGVHSTFFITGQWATVYPDLVQQIALEHEVANHSWSHPDFATISDSRILDEMQRTEVLLTKLTGQATTKPFWRAPFGSRNRHILSLLENFGYPYEVLWTADSADWTEVSAAQVRANVNKAARNGAIIVEHCGSDQTAAVLPQIIADLQGKGFRLVTVSEILRD